MIVLDDTHLSMLPLIRRLPAPILLPSKEHPHKIVLHGWFARIPIMILCNNLKTSTTASALRCKDNEDVRSGMQGGVALGVTLLLLLLLLLLLSLSASLQLFA